MYEKEVHKPVVISWTQIDGCLIQLCRIITVIEEQLEVSWKTWTQHWWFRCLRDFRSAIVIDTSAVIVIVPDDSPNIVQTSQKDIQGLLEPLDHVGEARVLERRWHGDGSICWTDQVTNDTDGSDSWPQPPGEVGTQSFVLWHPKLGFRSR